jgi:hypothetical protein
MMISMNKQRPTEPADLAEAARQLRAVVEALPPRTTSDRATARRVEGAALALGSVVEQRITP